MTAVFSGRIGLGKKGRRREGMKRAKEKGRPFVKTDLKEKRKTRKWL